MELVVAHARVGSIAVVQLAGEIDLATLPRLSDALARAVNEAAGATLAVDVDGVVVMDDAALGLVLGAAGRARIGGGDVVVVCSASALRERLALTGFDR